MLIQSSPAPDTVPDRREAGAGGGGLGAYCISVGGHRFTPAPTLRGAVSRPAHVISRGSLFYYIVYNIINIIFNNILSL